MNESLCSCCQDIFIGVIHAQEYGEDIEDVAGSICCLKRMQKHHSSFDELKRCGENQCTLCSALWLEFPREMQTELLAKDVVVASEVPCSDGRSNPKTQLFYDLTLFAVGHAEIRVHIRSATAPDLEDKDFKLELWLYHPNEYVDLTPSPPEGLVDSTFSARSMLRCAQWLTECNLSHDNCKVGKLSAWLPTRLIQVGRSDRPPRLVRGPELEKPSSYTTVSHCWGSAPVLKLTRELLEVFEQEIPVGLLPCTFSDAITITKELGIEYIWIDALCIIQDSPEDWQKECQVMADVYKNGYCNIAALKAVDSNGGIFSARDPSLLKPLLIRSYWRGMGNGLWHWKFQRHHRHIYREIERSVVHRRAWVLQERLLSPRNLHFGEHMIYWECRHSLGSETSNLKEALPRLFMFKGEVNVEMTSLGTGYLYRWENVIETYTAASLTFDSDKLAAVSALAREYQRIVEYGTGTGCRYLSGLWLPYLAQQLLWYSMSPLLTRRLDNGTPSWSWASLKGAVEYPIWTEERLEADILIVIHKADIFGPDTFSLVTGGILEITCLLWKLNDYRNQQGRERKTAMNITVGIIEYVHGDEIGPFDNANPEDEEHMRIYLHYDAQDSEDTCAADQFLLPIKLDNYYELFVDQVDDTTNAVLRGLIVESARSEFRRVGVFAIVVSRESDTYATLTVLTPSKCVECIGEQLREQGVLVARPRGSSDASIQNDSHSKDQFWKRSVIELT